MTKMEVLAIRSVAKALKVRLLEPKPDWMSSDLHRGKLETYK